VIGYDASSTRLSRVDDPAQETPKLAGHRDYIDVMRKLWVAPAIDIGRGGGSGSLRCLTLGPPRQSGA
jgi:hypothetical protein